MKKPFSLTITFFISMLFSSHYAVALDVSFVTEIGGQGPKNGQMRNPAGVALSADGEIVFVVDSGNSRILSFDKNGELKGSFGAKGSGDDRFYDPYGIAVSSDGKIFITDSGNNRVGVFDRDGKFVYSFGRKGDGDGEMNYPKGIAVDDQERVYIVDSGNRRVLVYTSDGIFIDSFGEKGERKGQFYDPTGIAATGDGSIWVTDTGNNRIEVFDRNGVFKGSYGTKGSGNDNFKSPTGIAADRYGRVIVVDSGNGRIQTLNLKGEFLGAFGSPGKGRAQFSQSQSVFMNGEGLFYIADSGNNRIQAFSAGQWPKMIVDKVPMSGRLSISNIVSFPSSGLTADSSGIYYALNRQESKVVLLDMDFKQIGSFGGKGKLSDPASIVIDDKDRIYVSDAGNHRVQVFNKEGTLLYEFGGKGSADGKFHSPAGMAYRAGKLWVADQGNYRVQVFNSDGIFLEKFGSKGSRPGEFSQPIDVAVSGSGEIYVADYGNNNVQVFSKEGKILKVIGKEGEEKGQFKGPRSIVVDDEGRLYVLESEKGFFGGGSGRVQVFNASGEFLFRFGSSGKARGELAAAESLYYLNREKINLFISDTGNSRVYILEIRDVPSDVKGLKADGDENGVRLSWQKQAASFVKGYRLYASADPKSGYRLVAEVGSDDVQIELEHKDKTSGYFYGISAVSKGGLEGPMNSVQDFFRTGYDRYAAGEFDAAASVFEEAFKSEPSNNRARYYVGLSYLSKGSADALSKASGIFSGLSKVQIYKEAASFNLGKIALIRSDFAAAEKEFNKVLELNPKNRVVHSLLGKAYFQQEMYGKSLDSLLAAVEVEPENPGIFEMLGVIYRSSRAYEKALSSFERGLSIDPGASRFHKELGNTYYAMSEPAKARMEYKTFLEKVPEDTDARLRLAETALGLKEGQEAFEQANIILAKDKGNTAAKIIKGKSLLLLGKKEDALLAFKGVLEVDSTNEEGLFMLASVYRELGIYKFSLETLQRLLEVNANHEQGHLFMAGITAESGDVDAAIREYRAVQKINPKNSYVYFPLGKLLFEKKEFDGARKELEVSLKYDPTNADAYLMLGSALKTLGRTGEAINAFQEVLNISKDLYLPHRELGLIFMESNMLDKALAEFTTAASIAPDRAEISSLLGRALLRKGRFDEAIAAFSSVVKADPSERAKKELNDAYDAKKKFLEAKQNVPTIEIRDVNVKKVFAALYKFYSDNPIGEIKIANNSDDTFSNVKISLKVMNYMDFSTDKELKEIKPRAIESLQLLASFNNKILDVTEITPAQAEVEVTYYSDKKEEKGKISIPFTIYDRNSLIWEDPAMTGAFVTLKDEPVKEFSRSITQQYAGTTSVINKQMSSAMMLFDALGAYGMVYSPDPNNPYEKVSMGEGAVDSLQYPRETLKLKTGDCDDLSVLFASLLENIGIETAFIGTPGHLHMMFKLDVDPKKSDTVSLDPQQYVILEDKVWIPVEMTLMGSSFGEAWYKGSDIYNRWKKENKVEVYKVHESWAKYQPATLPPASWSPMPPSKEKIDAVLNLEVKLQKTKKIAELLKPYREALEKNPNDAKARMQMGLIYSDNSQFAEAISEFNEVISLEPYNSDAYTNIGNSYLMAGKLDSAAESYRKAEESSPTDAEIKVNLTILFYRKGMIEEARKKFSEAVRLRPELKEERGLLNSMLFK